ncbi:hypothetical protein ACJ7VE_34125 [Streptomyces sp. PB17]|uniref:hypothetical protein n=1 Tax=Streptomyces sp. PB17 TaxID=3384158 RepID=UPI0038B68A42
MPIRPENLHRYPRDWPQISARIRVERAGGRCECTGHCGLTHPGGRCPAIHERIHPGTGPWSASPPPTSTTPPKT